MAPKPYIRGPLGQQNPELRGINEIRVVSGIRDPHSLVQFVFQDLLSSLNHGLGCSHLANSTNHVLKTYAQLSASPDHRSSIKHQHSFLR